MTCSYNLPFGISVACIGLGLSDFSRSDNSVTRHAHPYQIIHAFGNLLAEANVICLKHISQFRSLFCLALGSQISDMMADEAPSTTKTTVVVRGSSAEMADVPSNSSSHVAPVEDDQSPGVARIAAINRNLTRGDRIAVFIGVFLIAYAYGLDGTIRSTYQV
jgi:hypothetical protein